VERLAEDVPTVVAINGIDGIHHALWLLPLAVSDAHEQALVARGAVCPC